MSSIDASPLLGAGADGYQIERSLRFNSADSAYCSRAGWTGNQQLQTFSLWVKRTAFGSRQTLFGGTNSNGLYGLYFEFDANDALLIGDYSTSWAWQLNTTARYRDPSAWYHIVFAVDTANATASNRAKLYVNGVQVTAFSTASYMGQNYNMYWGYVSYVLAIGRLGEYNGQYFNGYLTEFHFIDGQALAPSSFGETDTITGVWKPKRYSGTYGTNGFYLKFADNSGTTSTTLGKDSSGNGNNWTPNNFSVTAGAGNDSLIDVPTPYADGGNGRGNYATLNPLSKGDDATLANGNLDVSYGSASFPSCTMATFGMSSGKWYWETTITASSLTNTGGTLGVTNTSNSSYNSVPQYPGYSANGWSYSGNTGTKYNNGTSTAYGSTFGVNDVIGCAFDADTGKIWWSKNGTWQASGDPAAGTNAAFTGLAAGTYFPAIGDGGGTSTFSAAHNFGQRSFSYTPPSGFLALNTNSLPEPSIKKPSSYFDVVTYAGTGNAATQTITLPGGFSPDLVWVKGRNESFFHRLTSTGLTQPNYLSTNSTDAEGTLNGTISSLNSNGFTVNGNNGTGGTNTSGINYVAWCWDESATPGFDIVTWTAQATAATVAHSLGVAPKFIIFKSRDNAAYPWFIYHSDVGIQKYLQFSTAGSTTNSTVFSTAPTSTVFDPGTGLTTGNGYNAMVAYLWSEVAGFSKFGSFTGNGSFDGPFVFCGFRPRYVMIKRTDAASDWVVWDAVRSTTNLASGALYPNGSFAQDGTDMGDFLSNGIKFRQTVYNASGGTYIFAAFAESPQKYSLAR